MHQLPSRPYLDWDQDFDFPHPETADPDGIVAVFGNLSPGYLLSAYRRGLFPWYSHGDPILWWSPNPRFVIFPENVHRSRSMLRVLKSGQFKLTCDYAFPEVITNCSRAKRPGQRGTWIVRDMVDAYIRLHELGFAHSFEAWKGERLVGGLYGVSLGAMFFGESMFHLEDNASKAAFLASVEVLTRRGIRLIDSQVRTAHMAGLGGVEIPRSRYLELLGENLEKPVSEAPWKGMIDPALFTVLK